MEFVGELVTKHFPGHGWYKGVVIEVIQVKKTLYARVEYEDGDKEDVPVKEVGKILMFPEGLKRDCIAQGIPQGEINGKKVTEVAHRREERSRPSTPVAGGNAFITKSVKFPPTNLKKRVRPPSVELPVQEESAREPSTASSSREQKVSQSSETGRGSGPRYWGPKKPRSDRGVLRVHLGSEFAIRKLPRMFWKFKWNQAVTLANTHTSKVETTKKPGSGKQCEGCRRYFDQLKAFSLCCSCYQRDYRRKIKRTKMSPQSVHKKAKVKESVGKAHVPVLRTPQPVVSEWENRDQLDEQEHEHPKGIQVCEQQGEEEAAEKLPKEGGPWLGARSVPSNGTLPRTKTDEIVVQKAQVVIQNPPDRLPNNEVVIHNKDTQVHTNNDVITIELDDSPPRQMAAAESQRDHVWVGNNDVPSPKDDVVIIDGDKDDRVDGNLEFAQVNKILRSAKNSESNEGQNKKQGPKAPSYNSIHDIISKSRSGMQRAVKEVISQSRRWPVVRRPGPTPPDPPLSTLIDPTCPLANEIHKYRTGMQGPVNPHWETLPGKCNPHVGRMIPKPSRTIGHLLQAKLTKLGERIWYRGGHGKVLCEGWIVWNGILCCRCGNVVGATEFEKCAGMKVRKPGKHIVFPCGKTLLELTRVMEEREREAMAQEVNFDGPPGHPACHPTQITQQPGQASKAPPPKTLLSTFELSA